MRILIVQTTRLGDVVQTSALTRAIRQKHPNDQIDMVVRAMGREAAEHNPDVDSVIVYEEDAIFPDLCSGDSDKMRRAYYILDNHFRTMQNKGYQLAYNCSHSVTSAMYLKLVGVQQVVGACMDSSWHFTLHGAWTNYFFTSVFHRDYNSLNLCDITKSLVTNLSAFSGLSFVTDPEDTEAINAILRERHVGLDAPVICFQMGASEDGKQWGIQNFVGLAQMLLEQRSGYICLIGTRAEGPQGEEFMALASGLAPGRVVPLYGLTTVPQVAALLERSEFLVTNDTGPMHIAAAVGCAVVLVSTGHVHFRETGPYGEGHCAVERYRAHISSGSEKAGPESDAPVIGPRQVMCAINIVCAQAPHKQVRQCEFRELANLEVAISRLAPDGYLDWYPVIRRQPVDRDLLRIAYRAMWLDSLLDRPDKTTEAASIRLMLQYYQMDQFQLLAVQCCNFAKIFFHLEGLMRYVVSVASLAAENLGRRADPEHVRCVLMNVQQAVDATHLYAEQHTMCAPLLRFSDNLLSSFDSWDSSKIMAMALQHYQSDVTRASLMASKLFLLAGIITQDWGGAR